MVAQKRKPDYYCINFVYCQPILIIVGIFGIFAVGSKRRIFSAIERVSAVQGHPRSMILEPIDLHADKG